MPGKLTKISWIALSNDPVFSYVNYTETINHFHAKTALEYKLIYKTAFVKQEIQR